MHIPAHTTTVVSGFSREAVFKAFGGPRKLLELVRAGEVTGVAAMVGCSSPKAGAEASHAAIARELIRNGVLVLASGCAAHALLNAGLCSLDAAGEAAPGLRAACEEAGIPPVLTVGSCSDNTRVIQVFAMLAHEARASLPEMPFAVSGPELANEKTMGQLLAVLAHGVTAAVGLTPNLPIPAMGPRTEQEPGAERNPMTVFFCEDGLRELVGARLIVEPDPARAAVALLSEMAEKRRALGWEGAAEAAIA
jgi:carbon-monoxide dehydrogenase catalytic subunit